MWAFIISGALYLVGVAVALVVKPSFMFAPDGTWKEFGIGQDSKRYTVFPFWLFCLVWAVVAYIIVLVMLPLFADIDLNSEQVNSESVYVPKNNKRSKKNVVNVKEDSDLVFDDEVEPVGLPKGYYVLNKKASRIAGTPKYIYLGEEEP